MPDCTQHPRPWAPAVTPFTAHSSRSPQYTPCSVHTVYSELQYAKTSTTHLVSTQRSAQQAPLLNIRDDGPSCAVHAPARVMYGLPVLHVLGQCMYSGARALGYTKVSETALLHCLPGATCEPTPAPSPVRPCASPCVPAAAVPCVPAALPKPGASMTMPVLLSLPVLRPAMRCSPSPRRSRLCCPSSCSHSHSH